jgi:hypothetical protein
MLHQHCVLFCSSDTGKESMTRLEFKQRLSIAIGAAKGDKIAKSCHSFTPVMTHDEQTMHWRCMPIAQGVQHKDKHGA